MPSEKPLQCSKVEVRSTDYRSWGGGGFGVSVEVYVHTEHRRANHAKLERQLVRLVERHIDELVTIVDDNV